MAAGEFTANGTTKKIKCDDNGAHITVQGTWGSGTVEILQYAEDETELLVYDSGTQVTMTANDDIFLKTRSGDVLALKLSGATSPDLKWTVRA